MRVTVVCPSAYPMLVPGKVPIAGGAEFQLLLLARTLRDRQHRVSFVVGDYGQPNELEVEGFHLYRAFRLYAGNRKLRFVPDMWKLRGALRKSRPDVVNQRSTAFYTGQTCAFAHEAGAAFVFSLGSDYNCYPDLLGRAAWPITSLYRWGIRSAEMVLAQTQQQASLVRKNLSRDDIEVVPNMVEVPPERGPSEDEGYVLWVGSLARWKRPELFIDLARSLPQHRFRLVGGPGEDRGYDREMHRLAEGVQNLHMAGFVSPDRMQEEYRGAAVCVNTSRIEGLPNTFLQSWAQGVPTVTVSIDPDGVIAGKGLGKISGTPERLSKVLEEFLSDPAEMQSAGGRARDHVLACHDYRKVGPVAEGFLLEALGRYRRKKHGGTGRS